jgi:hypothetical protein
MHIAQKWLAVRLTLCFFIASAGYAQNKVDQTLHIDIPTKLDKANVVVDLGHLVFNGDMPFALGDINLLASDLRDWNAKAQTKPTMITGTFPAETDTREL